jgi:hypothetical protein
MPSKSPADKIGPQPASDVESAMATSSDGDVSTPETSSSFTKMADPTVHFQNSTLHAYDNREALEQWLSQTNVGYQKLSRFTVHPKVRPDTVPDRLVGMLNKALNIASEEGLAPEKLEVSEFNIGRTGLVLSASWVLGNIVVFYDGESRVDVNHFVMDMDGKKSYALHNIIDVVFKNWPAVVKDDFPRGVGLVVNFPEHYINRENGERPYWD